METLTFSREQNRTGSKCRIQSTELYNFLRRYNISLRAEYRTPNLTVGLTKYYNPKLSKKYFPNAKKWKQKCKQFVRFKAKEKVKFLLRLRPFTW